MQPTSKLVHTCVFVTEFLPKVFTGAIKNLWLDCISPDLNILSSGIYGTLFNYYVLNIFS